MAIEIRNPRDAERAGLFVALDRAFGGEASPAEAEGALAATRKTMPLDRIFGAYEDDRPVGLSAAWPFALTIPGGELPCPGVTWVGVLPSHRRRGLARDLMRSQLEEIHERGEPRGAGISAVTIIAGRAAGAEALTKAVFIAGRDEAAGAIRYRTTPLFERVFGLESLSQLPRLDDLGADAAAIGARLHAVAEKRTA